MLRIATFVPNLIFPSLDGSLDGVQTGHCHNPECDNYYASTCRSRCPQTEASKQLHCESDRKRCQECKSTFIDTDRSVCDTCMITHGMIQCYGCGVEIEQSKSWVPQAKAYLCTSCQHMHCKSCGRSDLNLNIEGFCYECEDDYENKGWCIKCGEFKHVHVHTEVCRECEDKMYG